MLCFLLINFLVMSFSLPVVPCLDILGLLTFVYWFYMTARRVRTGLTHRSYNFYGCDRLTVAALLNDAVILQGLA